uniref:Clumping factor B-like n=1 Tax=Nicotiana tabacum TaxID=4097 RepID=A0A1S4A7Z1_TOBAC|nr:PREDICTED: clumping factor B-like [Nicotiana tabacum]
MDRTDKLVNILTGKDTLDICNELEDGDTLDIYVTHAAPLCVVNINEASKGVGGSNSGAFKSTNVLEEEEDNESESESAPTHEPTPSPSPCPSPSPEPAPVPAPSREQESGVDSESDFDNSEGKDDNENDSDFDNSDRDKSDGVDLHVSDDKDYGSDVHEEFVEYKDELKKYRRKMSERPKDRGDINLGDAGVDIGFDELRTGSKQDRYTGLVGTDEPYFGSSDAESFPSDAEDEFDEEHKEKIAAKRRKKALIFGPTVKKIT